MKPLYLSDIDDVLITTMRKIPDDQRDGAVAASTLRDGTASGYRTLRLAALDRLVRTGDLVPITARSRETMSRVDIPQAPAVCSNGGCIIASDGRLDEAWHEEMRSRSTSGRLQSIYERFASSAPTGVRHWMVEEEGVPLYFVVKHDGSPAALDRAASRLPGLLIDEFAGSLESASWRVTLNDNNLALLPPWVSKRRAAAEVIRRARELDPQRLVIGIGDSLSDLGFMQLCDFAMTPVASQVGGRLFQDVAA